MTQGASSLGLRTSVRTSVVEPDPHPAPQLGVGEQVVVDAVGVVQVAFDVERPVAAGDVEQRVEVVPPDQADVPVLEAGVLLVGGR